ncbi:peptidyl-prolyl cis-trans isomerase FKBP20-2, chloroplastic [Nymphaea colorata]|nr:peptidyl-prolyl cis-trans isomerase FKBP20-2, chloroplastic [Nymphaea colorata]XP_031503296.1 peptidyl-prolyl cis-trans isomerase FKBP20-2, chloroplastic [Nymphaea colorata]XP_031503297.1 peptidyl-prolyl cis-trans isomerase FKBP20-2, chloroplastic [Nymphaea colorata]
MMAPTPAVSINFSSSLLPSHPLLTLPCQALGFRDLFNGRFKWPRPTISRIERKEGSFGDPVTRKHFILISLVAFGCYGESPASGKVKKTSYDGKRLLEQNRKIQAANNAPKGFPNFVREGFQVKVVTPEQYVTTDSGLIYLDIVVGQGDCPKLGQQVIFHYIGYNESGRRIDSTYAQGSPARIRLGTNALVPGFEEGLKEMRPGGKRRLIIPPELGPPVGPSTFFSSKQFEVFDVELLSVQNCQRRTIGFYSDLVCN